MNAPDHIFLQWDAANESDPHDCTWCQDRVNESDVEYVRVPKIEPLVLDDNRCAVCGWTLDPEGAYCVRGNCSMRPFPERFYDPERKAREYQRATQAVKYKTPIPLAPRAIDFEEDEE